MASKRHSRGGWLRRLLDAGPPIDLNDWSLDPGALELVLTEVATGRRRIVECGSGVSTILIARLLRDRGDGTLHALEHDRDWAGLTRRRIAAEGLGGQARVIEAPLKPDRLAQPGCEWYSADALDELPQAGVDLLLVDGPPASPGLGLERSRYPALPRLASRLAPGAKVILDDAARSGERWTLQRWQRELGLHFEHPADGVAVAVCGSRSVAARARLVRALDGLGPLAALGREAREWSAARRS